MISCRGPVGVIAVTVVNAAAAVAQGRAAPASGRADTLAIAVAGSGVDHLATALVHSVRGKPHGIIREMRHGSAERAARNRASTISSESSNKRGRSNSMSSTA